MRPLSALMMLLGALAVLMSAAAPASARADAPTPPCHEATMHHDGAGTPSPAPDTAMKAMDFCVACVNTPSLRSPERARPAPPRPAAATPPAALPAGERPAPDPHPPRPILH